MLLPTSGEPVEPDLYPHLIVIGHNSGVVISAPNEHVLVGFVDYLKVQKGLARLSVAAYLRDLRQFAATLKSQKPSRRFCRRLETTFGAFSTAYFPTSSTEDRSLANCPRSGILTSTCCSTTSWIAIPR
jgi:hypothetical protein